MSNNVSQPAIAGSADLNDTLCLHPKYPFSEQAVAMAIADQPPLSAVSATGQTTDFRRFDK